MLSKAAPTQCVEEEINVRFVEGRGSTDTVACGVLMNALAHLFKKKRKPIAPADSFSIQLGIEISKCLAH